MLALVAGIRPEYSGIYPGICGKGPAERGVCPSGSGGRWSAVEHGNTFAEYLLKEIMKKISLVLFLVLLGVCLLRGQPVNDEPETATSIVVTDEFTPLEVNYTGATSSDVDNSGRKDVWYSFTAQSGGFAIRRVSEPFLVLAQLFSVAQNGDLTSLGLVLIGAPDYVANLSTIEESGTFLLRVFHFQPSIADAVASFELKQVFGPPDNDDITQATPIVVTDEFTATDMIYIESTVSGIDNACGINPAFAYDVWYTFPVDGRDVTVKNVSGGTNVILEFFFENGEGTVPLGCINSVANGSDNILHVTNTGIVFMRIIRPFAPNASLTLELRRASVTPPNNDPATAISINVTDVFTPLIVEYVGATSSMVPTECGPNPSISYDVWYTFPAAGSDVIFRNLQGGYDAWIELFLENENDDIVVQECFYAPANGSNNTFQISNTGSILMRVTSPAFQDVSLTLELKQGAALPVSLTTFQAQATPNQKSTHLTWQTASESGNDYFDVQHSTNGQTFTDLGRVTGAGTSQSVREYTFTDNTPQSGTNFYRLRQVDFDGTATLSEVRSVAFAGDGLKVIPNPSVAGSVRLDIPESYFQGLVSLHGLDGRQLRQQSAAQTTLSTVDLPAGIYLLRVRSGVGELVERLVVR